MHKSESLDIRLFQIVYSDDPNQTNDPGYRVLDNRDNPRPDWREYWPIRNYLRSTKLSDTVLYGFFSPRFRAKTQLSHHQVMEITRKHRLMGADVVLFSPQPDMGSFFRHVFEQSEVFDPGMTRLAQSFFDSVKFPVQIDRLIMDSRHVVFSNFFVASGAFWKQWFSITEALFNICEGREGALKQALTESTRYPGQVQRKVFLLERIASVLLASQARWKTGSYNSFLTVWSLSGLRRHRDDAIISDALKLAFREQGFEAYGAVFERIRQRINTLEQATIVVEAENPALSLSDSQQPAYSFELAEQQFNAGKVEIALAMVRQALASADGSKSALIWFQYATHLAKLDRHAEAEGACRQALFLQPKLYPAYLNLGLLLERLGRLEEACDAWKRGLSAEGIRAPSQRSHCLSLLNQLGRLLEQMRQYESAERFMKESLTIDPKQSKVLHHWVHIRQKQCRWPVLEPFGEVTVAMMVEASSPLATMAASDDPEVQLRCAQRTVKERVPLRQRIVAPNHRYRHKRIRIGYVSGDLCLHAVGLLIVELLEHHDKSRFEVFGYCWSRDDGTSIQRRIRSALDHHVRVGSKSDEAAAESIRRDEIDIVIDLQGLTSGARPGILSAGPAPIQISYLGYPGSCAIPYVDYIVADEFVYPRELEQHFSEKPMRLDACFQTSDRHRTVGATPDRSSLGLPEEAFVFCAFNNNYKFTFERFHCWMRILKACPNSVLWLLGDNPWSIKHMQEAATRVGVSHDRLILASRVAPPDYLARFKQADLFLDTFPYNAGTTANDALWMGLPILTHAGKTYISRMAGSLLHSVGLDHLICTNEIEYEQKAIALGLERDRKTVKEARKHLENLKVRGELFNTESFARDFEDKLVKLLEDPSGSSTRANGLAVRTR
jgi:predicted O-linked N-acetylglucosamine transferase (SPINDLY family)